jgi:rhodanese-related sulfurtransferase
MKRILILMLSLSALLGCKSESKPVVKVVSVSEFSEGLSNDIQLVDVRTPEEYADGHIENSQLINVKSDDFQEKIQDLDKDQPVYIYCRSGNRSQKAAKIMTELGFKEIVDLKGGYKAWSAQ